MGMILCYSKLVEPSLAVEYNLWNNYGVDKQRGVNESSIYYSVGMSIYHFKLVEKFDAESGDRKIVYSCFDVDCSEMFFDISGILIRFFGGTIRVKEGAVFD
jgi:hypothetical protein